MLRNISNTLLLRGLWRFKPIQVVMLWIFLIYQGWMASPYFMYYVVGEPLPGSAPRYVGALHIDGQLRRTGSGWSPPRYFVQTDRGAVEFHCGFLPYVRECPAFIGNLSDYQGLAPIEVGIDPYWGVDYLKLPTPYVHKNEGYEPKWVSYRREVHLRGYADDAAPIVKKTLGRSKHFWASIWFSLGCSIYLLLMALRMLIVR